MSHQLRTLAYSSTHMRKMDNLNPKYRKVEMQNAIKIFVKRGLGVKVWMFILF